jgi:hypothetical protein
MNRAARRSRVFLLVAMSLLVAGAAAPLACLPTYTFGDQALADSGNDTLSSEAGPGLDATEGEAQADATAGDSTTNADAGSDAPGASDGSLSPVAVADVGSKVYSTGYGEQLHVVYAQNDKRYWFFYVDDTSLIKTRATTDFVSFTDGATIPLGVADGNNFSVAYADLGGTDVIHIVVNASSATEPTSQTMHVRATISGGNLVTTTYPLPDTADNSAASGGGSTCPSGAPSTTILSDGHVYDVTAWTGHPNKGTACDTNMYLANVDTGATWTPAFAHDGYYVSVSAYTFSHEIISLQAGGALAVWPDVDTGNAVTSFASFGWALSSSFPLDAGAIGTNGTVPDTSAELFAANGTTMSSDDWALCRLTDADIHLVRHVGSSSVNAFEEVRYNGANWQTASPAASVHSLSNTGVALLSDADPSHGMLLVTIGVDNALNFSKWTSNGGWTALANFPGSTQRQSLAGSGCGSAHPRVFWTEGTGPYTIMSADLSRLLP